MKFIYGLGLSVAVLIIACSCSKSPTNSTETPPIYTEPVKTEVSFWLTKGDQTALLKKQNIALNFSATSNSSPTIEVDPNTTFQTIDGFGYT
ncbi:MAG: glucosylceramidase, partial [Flavobacterium sp.]